MPAGLQTFDASGALVVDIDTRIAKVLGVLNVGASYTGGAMSGSVTDARFTAYTGVVSWFGLISSTFFRHAEHPVISISGNTLSWQFPTGSPRPDTSIVYGIF
jgi:hypothetical protein